jgi:hypothetical protein
VYFVVKNLSNEAEKWGKEKYPMVLEKIKRIVKDYPYWGI